MCQKSYLFKVLEKFIDYSLGFVRMYQSQSQAILDFGVRPRYDLDGSASKSLRPPRIQLNEHAKYLVFLRRGLNKSVFSHGPPTLDRFIGWNSWDLKCSICSSNDLVDLRQIFHGIKCSSCHHVYHFECAQHLLDEEKLAMYKSGKLEWWQCTSCSKDFTTLNPVTETVDYTLKLHDHLMVRVPSHLRNRNKWIKKFAALVLETDPNKLVLGTQFGRVTVNTMYKKFCEYETTIEPDKVKKVARILFKTCGEIISKNRFFCDDASSYEQHLLSILMK
jgi:hypothetical protein